MKFKDDVLALVGAALGGVVGYFAFFWIVRQGFYGLILPGGLLGIGAGMFMPRSMITATLCGAAALGLGLFTEWQFAPFKKDDSFGFFLAHAHELKPITLLMIAAGTALGFWIPFRRHQDAIRLNDRRQETT